MCITGLGTCLEHGGDRKVITAFEIQVLNDGDWKIDSIFDDKDLATFEANRVFGRGLYDTVRVVQEIYNEMTNTASARTVSELRKAAVLNPVETLAKAALAAQNEAAQRVAEPAELPPLNNENDRATDGNGTLWWLGLMAKSFGIAIGGLAFLFVLRLLYELL